MGQTIAQVGVCTKNHGGILDNPFEFKKKGDEKIDKILSLICPQKVLKKIDVAPDQSRLAKTTVTQQRASQAKAGDESAAGPLAAQRADTPATAASDDATPPDPDKTDKEYGPTVKEIMPDSCKAKLTPKQLEFVNKYQNKKLFYILHNNSDTLLNADKNIRDVVSIGVGSFKAPRILTNAVKLKENITDALSDVYEDILKFRQNLELAKDQESNLEIKKKANTLKVTNDVKWEKTARDKYGLKSKERTALTTEFGEDDARWLCTEEGQLLFLALREAINIKLCGEVLSTANEVKTTFGKTIGNSEKKAENTLSSIRGHSVAFVQECDTTFLDKIGIKSFWERLRQGSYNSYWSIKGQASAGASANVLLRKYDWAPPARKEKEPRVIDFTASYGKIDTDRCKEGKLNGVLARHRETGKLVFAVSCHAKENKYLDRTKGSRAIDGRNDALDQLESVLDELEKLRTSTRESIALMIGGDFNTKSPEAMKALSEFCTNKRLKLSKTGTTSDKMRCETTQQDKAGDAIEVIEDFIITQDDTPQVEGLTFPKPNSEVEYGPNDLNYSDHKTVKTAIVLKAARNTIERMDTALQRFILSLRG